MDTWLSCEETDRGYVLETDPRGGEADRRDAMGRFKHEAAAADPDREVIYLTEDESDGNSSQRGPAGSSSDGYTCEVTGPFRK